MMEEKRQVNAMLFRKVKKNAREIYFTTREIVMVRNAMLRFRNKAIRQGLPTEDIDRLLLQLT